MNLKMSLPEYLDNASTTPVDSRVKEAMLPYFDEIFGNASSNHIYGKQAKEAVGKARKQVASIINADADEIIFTSGATEAINLGIKGYWESHREKGNHIVTVKTEHKAVLETCKYLETLGVEVTYLGVDENGLISIDELGESIRTDTILISVMYVNNEIGVIQDIPKIGEIARENDVAFFCDATQAIGKIPLDVLKDNIDMLCMSAHKFNGPKGVGALYLKHGIEISPQMHGGGQEKGLRGGTYSTPLIVGLGESARIALERFDSLLASMLQERDKWTTYFEDQGLGVVKFKNTSTAPHILSIQLSEDAEDFLMANASKIAASTGSACNSSIVKDSHVIRALDFTSNRILRISF
jgi:cysteine desulfurase